MVRHPQKPDISWCGKQAGCIHYGGKDHLTPVHVTVKSLNKQMEQEGLGTSGNFTLT
jgi:hypothetical protein